MSITGTVQLICDGCGWWREWDLVAKASVRIWARQKGWHHVNPSRDICPDCWEKGKR